MATDVAGVSTTAAAAASTVQGIRRSATSAVVSGGSALPVSAGIDNNALMHYIFSSLARAA